jgi:hypothetical protein
VEKPLREMQKSLRNGKTIRRRSLGHHRFSHWYAPHNFDSYEEFREEYQAEYDKFSREVHRDGYWLYKAPNWYYHMTVTVSQRHETNVKLRKLHFALDYDDLIFPEGRKIHKGYW